MYELQLVNNGCLAEYSEDYKVFVDSILLDSETLKKLNSDEDVYTDIIDVEFSPAVKKGGQSRYISSCYIWIYGVFTGSITNSKKYKGKRYR